MAACTDGAIWLYSGPLRRRVFLPTGIVDSVRTAIADDGNAAVALDAQGRLLWLDLEAARRVLAASSGTRTRSRRAGCAIGIEAVVVSPFRESAVTTGAAATA